MSPRAILLSIAVLICLTGCSGSSADTSAPATTKVSLRTACQLLVNHDGNSNPLADLITFTGMSTAKQQADVANAHVYLDTMQDVSRRAPTQLATQLQALTKTTTALLKTLTNGGDWDSSNFRAAATDIRNQCEDYFDD